MIFQDEFLKLNIIDNIPLGNISKSDIHGHGLFAKQVIPKNSTLCKLDGQIILWNDYEQIVSYFEPKLKDLKDYFFMEWNALSVDILLVRALRTKYSYINHSRTPNVKILKESMTIISIVDILPNDEILLDYRDEPLNERYLNGHGKTYL